MPTGIHGNSSGRNVARSCALTGVLICETYSTSMTLGTVLSNRRRAIHALCVMSNSIDIRLNPEEAT